VCCSCRNICSRLFLLGRSCSRYRCSHPWYHPSGSYSEPDFFSLTTVPILASAT
jgi:hypothetical protein